MQLNNHRLIFTLASVLSLAVPAGTTEAAESVIQATPVGGTDINQALLPPPGFYGGIAAIPWAEAPALTNTYGNRLPISENVKVIAAIGAVAGLYVYPWQPFGGTIATSLQVPVWSLCLGPESLPSVGTCRSGLGDIYSDAFLWSKNIGLFGVTPGASKFIPYGLTVEAGFAFKAPTGSYNATNSFNIGANLWIFTPNVALTYNTGPNWSFGDSTQLSARLFLSFPTTNPATNYKSGNVLDVDWSATQIFGNWQAGITGYYTYQFTNDVGINIFNGVNCPGIAGVTCIDGDRNGQFAIGPVIQYTFPDSGVAIKAKFTTDLWAKNNLVDRILVLSIAMRL
jgi:hypothetical protein